MSSQRYTKAIICLAALAWAAILWFGGAKIESAWLKPLSTVTSIVLVTVLLFDFWLWKLPFLHGWFVKRRRYRRNMEGGTAFELDQSGNRQWYPASRRLYGGTANFLDTQHAVDDGRIEL